MPPRRRTTSISQADASIAGSTRAGSATSKATTDRSNSADSHDSHSTALTSVHEGDAEPKEDEKGTDTEELPEQGKDEGDSESTTCSPRRGVRTRHRAQSNYAATVGDGEKGTRTKTRGSPTADIELPPRVNQRMTRGAAARDNSNAGPSVAHADHGPRSPTEEQNEVEPHKAADPDDAEPCEALADEDGQSDVAIVQPKRIKRAPLKTLDADKKRRSAPAVVSAPKSKRRQILSAPSYDDWFEVVVRKDPYAIVTAAVPHSKRANSTLRPLHPISVTRHASPHRKASFASYRFPLPPSSKPGSIEDVVVRVQGSDKEIGGPSSKRRNAMKDEGRPANEEHWTLVVKPDRHQRVVR